MAGIWGMKMALCSYLVGSLLNLVQNCPRLISSMHSDSSVHYPLFLPSGYVKKKEHISAFFYHLGSSINRVIIEMWENNSFILIILVGLIILQIVNKAQSLFHINFFFAAAKFGYRLGQSGMHH